MGLDIEELLNNEDMFDDYFNKSGKFSLAVFVQFLFGWTEVLCISKYAHTNASCFCVLANQLYYNLGPVNKEADLKRESFAMFLENKQKLFKGFLARKSLRDKQSEQLMQEYFSKYKEDEPEEEDSEESSQSEDSDTD